MTDPEPQAPAALPAPAAKKSSPTTVAAIIVIIAFAVICGIVGIFKASSGSDTETTRSNNAASACEDAVRDQLKAPSTAKFSGERYTDNDPDWLVTGDVDAQNSFGAMIRNHFTCDLTRSGDTMTVTDTTVG